MKKLMILFAAMIVISMQEHVSAQGRNPYRAIKSVSKIGKGIKTTHVSEIKVPKMGVLPIVPTVQPNRWMTPVVPLLDSSSIIHRYLPNPPEVLLPRSNKESSLNHLVAGTPLVSQADMNAYLNREKSNYLSKTEYSYNTLISSLSDPSDHEVDMDVIQQTKNDLRNIVTESSLWNGSVALDLASRYDALIAFALISEDGQATVELSKEFLSRGYGPLNVRADNAVIEACLLAGEAGELFLREMLKQRIKNKEEISAGWKTAKEIITDLYSPDELAYYDDYGIDSNRLKELMKKRTIIQNKLNRNH